MAVFRWTPRDGLIEVARSAAAETAADLYHGNLGGEVAMDLWIPSRKPAGILSRSCLLALVFCLLFSPVQAQDGAQSGPPESGRIMWEFRVFCWPAERFAEIMWQTWGLVEFGKGEAMPPIMRETDQYIAGDQHALCRFWASEDGTWAWSYRHPNRAGHLAGYECLEDIGSNFRFRQSPIFGQPTSLRID